MLRTAVDQALAAIDQALESHVARFRVEEVGTVTRVDKGIATVTGLAGARAEELLRFPGGVHGIAFNLEPEQVGVVLLNDAAGISAGMRAQRTGRVVDAPVGRALLGRVIDALGRPLDGLGGLEALERRPVERDAPAIIERIPVNVPLETGIKVIDALIPIGRGQRELIIGDRQSGKTAIAVDTLINQRASGVIAIYCSIGQRGASLSRVVEELRRSGNFARTVVVAADGSDPPGLQFITPYAATTMAEWFMAQGEDVVVVYDDLTRHARAYRELSLLLRRPPGREAYPGDIFYIHSRLLERATNLKRGGSLTALPIVETQAQNLSAYIPTNLISITDGQIVLSPDLFRKGVLPAVDVGRSVSRVGGKTQLPAYRAVAGPVRLAYAQFLELEEFARFATRLDETTRRTIERGRRVRQVLQQPVGAPLPAAEQIAALLAVNEGLFDGYDPERVAGAEESVRDAVREQLPELCHALQEGAELDETDRAQLLDTARKALVGRKRREGG
ncbi:alternate F1F0 ATPase, F1 subunit alpha [Endothiovibrio diazotrophicus]